MPASPGDATIGNRDEILFNGGFLPGAVVCKDDSGRGNLRSATIDEDGNLKFSSMDNVQMAYGVNGDQTWNNNVTLFYGNCGAGRHITLAKDGGTTRCVAKFRLTFLVQ